MKKTICLFTILTVSFLLTFSFAQESATVPTSFTIKAYNTVLWDGSSLTNEIKTFSGYSYATQKVNYIIHPSIALQWSKKNIQEIEVSSLGFKENVLLNQTIYDSLNNTYINLNYKTKTSNIALKYEYMLRLFKKLKNVHPLLGFAASPYFQREVILPYNSSLTNQYITVLGVRTFIIPRIQWNVSQRLLIDLNIPICLTDINITSYRVDDPSYSKSQNKASLSNFNALPDYISFRIGAGWRL